jgi:hypothetical protein
MIIYDSTTIAFIAKTQGMAKEILREIGYEVKTSRFLFKNYFYPLNIVVYEGEDWGHFNHDFLQIGLNRKLIYLAKDSVVRDVLKHELAHYLTRLHFGTGVQAHGREFYEICDKYKFPKHISDATMNLENSNQSKTGDLASERILEKVKKLLTLAQSSNAHEAELATIKANDLLLRHNLEHIHSTQDEPIYIDRILTKPKKDAKFIAIYDILRHFIVRPVFHYGRGSCTLEVSGTLTNVKLARYISEFLDRELDHLWKETKAEFGFTGLRAKNSFFIGVARGFEEKMNKVKHGYSDEDQRSLIVVEKNLTEQIDKIYGRLSSTRSTGSIDGQAQSAGHAKGKNLIINKGVETSSRGLLLTK